jgi:hypothetical protein
MAEGPVDVLDLYCQDAELTHGELWLRYFELGGMPSAHDHDVIAQALNERFVELGGAGAVPYSEDGRQT